MKRLVLAAALSLAGAASAAAQASDLTGTWSGQWRTVIYGSNTHHPGAEATADAPRIREITFSFDIEGQDGNLLWGKSWSNPENKEPFAATITADGKTIVGADSDGSITGSIAAQDRLELCYAHAAHGGPSIVASCGSVQRSQ
jgi:hypothetical protein